MGAGQSKAECVNEKLIVEQLQAMKVKESVADEEFVQVNNEKVVGRDHRASNEMGLDVKSVEKWGHRLLEDPKNR